MVSKELAVAAQCTLAVYDYAGPDLSLTCLISFTKHRLLLRRLYTMFQYDYKLLWNEYRSGQSNLARRWSNITNRVRKNGWIQMKFLLDPDKQFGNLTIFSWYNLSNWNHFCKSLLCIVYMYYSQMFCLFVKAINSKSRNSYWKNPKSDLHNHPHCLISYVQNRIQRLVLKGSFSGQKWE